MKKKILEIKKLTNLKLQLLYKKIFINLDYVLEKKLNIYYLVLLGLIFMSTSSLNGQTIRYNYELNNTEHSCMFCKKKITTSEIKAISNVNYNKDSTSLRQIRDAIAYSMTLYLWNINATWTTLINEECPSIENKTPKHQWRDEQKLFSASSSTSIKQGDDSKNSIKKLYEGPYGFINKGLVDIILKRVYDKIDEIEPFKNLIYEEEKQKKIVSDNIALKGEIKIGNQIWMTKNLNVDKFSNGDQIIEAKTDEEWQRAAANKQPAWCYYKNDPSNGEKYGKLYNWYAVNDTRGIAPLGYHIPSNEEWEELLKFLGGEPVTGGNGLFTERRSSVAGGKLKSTIGWEKDINVTNSSYFSALPGGGRSNSGVFVGQGYHGYWWSSIDIDSSNALLRHLMYFPNDFEEMSFQKSFGYSIRCLKGEETIKVKEARQKKLDDEKEKAEAMRIIEEKMALSRKKSLTESENALIGHWNIEGKITGKEDLIELEISALLTNDARKINLEITSSYWSILRSNVYGPNVVTKDKKIATQINIINGFFEINDNILNIHVDSNDITNTNFQDKKYSLQLTNLLNTILKNLKVEENNGKKIELSNNEFDLKLKGKRD